MTNIFVGLFFIFFDLPIYLTAWFDIDIELGIYDMVLSLAPSFVGFILIFTGLHSMRGKTKNFTYAQIMSGVLALIDFVRWSLMLLGLLNKNESYFLIIDYIGTCVVLYFIATGIKEIAQNAQVKLNQKSIMVHTVIWILLHFVNLLITNNSSDAFSQVMMVALVFIINIIYILAFYRVTKKYRKALLMQGSDAVDDIVSQE